MKTYLPQKVARITKIKSGVRFWTHGVDFYNDKRFEEERTGDLYLFPGFEEIPVVLTKPRGSFAKHNKEGYKVWEPETGLLIFELLSIKNVKHDPMDALEGAHARLKMMGKAVVLEAIGSHLEKLYL